MGAAGHLAAPLVALAGGGDGVGHLDPPALVALPDLLPRRQSQEVWSLPSPAMPSEDLEDLGICWVASHPSWPGAGP